MSTSARQGTQTTGAGYSTNYAATTPSTAFSGWVIFAATMMVLLGGFKFIDGLIALFNSAYYGPSTHLLFGTYQSWGWWSLIVGALLVIAGLSLFTGSLWARIVGIVLAVVSALSQLVFIAVFPLWAIAVIAIDVIVIYALTVNQEIG